ncbi:dinitrogenase iron-molybdenum cofactor [Thermococcus aggregans]|uniref:Dinitrogenase iron-molybdenum cofactor n=1 Tax=Thermococcus aggregans TaxID=110163 RepID=A0A9E7MXB2_THEAG|nr:NifB/NifX family molybdenum-iron cluster-binding protein [Thermococcus aggregans]USS40522.1 dinitrogenase iron-molybdenum cofactor [Thermococcus aggregans]
MKIAVPSSKSGGLEDTVAAVFARAPVFTIIDVENEEIKNVKVIQNQAMNVPSGAGPMVVQMLIKEGVNAVITPQLGPNAMEALQAAGIKVYTFPPGTPIKEAVEKISKGEIPQPFQAPPQAYYPPQQSQAPPTPQSQAYYPPFPMPARPLIPEPPRHKECIHYKEGKCEFWNLPVHADDPACPFFIPKNAPWRWW